MLIEKQTSSKLKDYSIHLKNLRPEDKFTRFGIQIKDEMIDKFILSILYDLEKHHIFAAVDRGVVLGYVHLAQIKDNSWELGISIEAGQQGKGVGDKLIKYAISWAKMHDIENMFMHCITDNKKIQHLARKNGLKTVERDGTDITAMVELPDLSLIEKTNAIISEQFHIIKKITKLHSELISNISLVR